MVKVMKEFRAIVKLKNNRLLERREKLGVTGRALALMANISEGIYYPLETMRLSPIGRNMEWSSPALKLALFYECEPSDLFPDAIRKIKIRTVEKSFDFADVPALQNAGIIHMIEGPEESMERKEMNVALNQVLKSLTIREREVLQMRFGLGCDTHTLEEVGYKQNVNRERIRQIEAKALRKLRHPSRADMLRTIGPDDL